MELGYLANCGVVGRKLFVTYMYFVLMSCTTMMTGHLTLGVVF